jgi:hypothetical protein
VLRWRMRWLATLGLGVALGGCGDAPTEAPSADPTAWPLRRLTASEVKAAWVDVLGELPPSAELVPRDTVSHGFDVVAEGLTVTPQHLAAWEAAAWEGAWLVLPERVYPLAVADAEVALPEGEALVAGAPYDLEDESSRAKWTVELARAGSFRVAIDVDTSALTEVVRVELRPEQLEDGPLAVWDVAPGQTTLTATITAAAGPLRAGVRRLGAEGGPVGVYGLTLTGPVDEDATPARARWARCALAESGDVGDDACVRALFTGLAPWAWRRPVGASEVDGLIEVVRVAEEGGHDRPDAVRLGVAAVLLRPDFLFHVEPTEGPVPGWVVANRMAAMLWSAPPDAALRDAADALAREPAARAAAVERMLADPRSAALTHEFAAQWLGFRLIAAARPDPVQYPMFTESVRWSMTAEVEALFDELVRGDHDLRELVAGDLGFADPTLAGWYGVPAPGEGLEVYDASAIGRGGLLGTAGWQMALSFPTRTSPVRRGVWVLSQLLCASPDAPPADVPALPEDAGGSRSVRDRLAQHRADPGCASCHAAIDPIGLALEHFDHIGRWRAEDEEGPIDASGVLDDGRAVDGSRELAVAVADDPRFMDCAVEQVFTWSHRRAPTPADAVALAQMRAEAAAAGSSLRALLVAAVTSPTFTAPRAGGP